MNDNVHLVGCSRATETTKDRRCPECGVLMSIEPVARPTDQDREKARMILEAYPHLCERTGVLKLGWRNLGNAIARGLADEREAARKARAGGARIVCLCGSTRFTARMLVIQWEMTKAGLIVLSWCALPDSYFGKDSRGDALNTERSHIGDQEGVKETVDEVHKRKIDVADEVYVINIGGYIGDSTRSEIEYGRAHGKPIRYLEPPPSEGKV